MQDPADTSAKSGAVARTPFPESYAYFGARAHGLASAFARASIKHLKPERVFGIFRNKAAADTYRRALGKGVAFDWTDYDTIGLHKVPISFARVRDEAVRMAAGFRDPKTTLLAFDMGWGLDTASATANFQAWMAAAIDIAAATGVKVVSIYNRGLLIDEHLLTALRGHPLILANEGVLPNSHWLPPALAQATLREQVNHWLGQVAPSLVQVIPNAQSHAAEGADPMWLIRRTSEADPPGAGSKDRWKIRCFGRLRIYRADGSQVQWSVAGGATLKTKTLFAYLLQQGGQGASTDDLADLLWPDADDLEVARNRLYHAVRSLRRALSDGPVAGDGHIIRDGENYVLTPPPNSWIDIASFEQLCRQSQTHISAGDLDEAIVCLEAADRLYSGDLFEDIPSEYVDDGERDWCWTRRQWLRDMFLKVQRDAARIYLQRGDYTASLNHSKKALAADPLCESAHEDAMRVFAAQNRRDAVERQYALYLKSLSRFDDRPRSAQLTKIYKSLVA